MSYMQVNRYDISYIVVIIFFSFLLFISNFSNDNKNINIAIVKYKGKEIMTVDMNKDQKIILKKKKYNLLLDDMIIEVKNKKIAVIKEKSPYHYCSLMGYVFEKNKVIICQPNHIIIILDNNNKTDIDVEVK